MNKEAFELVRQSVVESSMTDDDRLLERLRITCDKKLPLMRFLFRIFGKPCFPRGELVAVTGKAKSGKTLFNSILMACCVRDEVMHVHRSFNNIDGTRQNNSIKCLWYDTEQSEQSTQEILKDRVARMVGLSESPPSSDSPSPIENLESAPTPLPLKSLISESYDVFNVRCLNHEVRLRLFETAVHKYRPALVVLDGVRDLLADINDGVKAQEIVERLMKLAQETDCCLVCVLHQNKGAEDRNLRGWIGTELMNKAFEVYSCEKIKPENIFVVEQTHTRKYDLGELMFFRMDAETELPVICDAPTRYKAMNGYSSFLRSSDERPHMTRAYIWFDENNKPHPKTDELFYDALKVGPLYYSDLQVKVQSMLNCGTDMWNNMFREMRDRGVIIRTKNMQGKAVWQLASDQSEKPKPQPTQPDLFSGHNTGSGDSPSS